MNIKTADCGIYYLWDGEVVQYIGQTRSSVSNRVNAHIRNNISFIQVFFDPCSPEELDAREAAAIKEFKPKLNIIRV